MQKPPPKLPANLIPIGDRGPAPTWQEVLARAGYPTDVLVLDFETYFSDDYSLKKMSTIEYIMDERFEVLCLAYHLEEHDVQNISRADSGGFRDCEHAAGLPRVGCVIGEQVAIFLDRLRRIYGDRLESVTVLAQNFCFDGMVLKQHYGFTPKYVIDLLGLSRAWNARSRHDLDTLAKRWKLGEKGKTADFKYVSLKPRILQRKGRPPQRIASADAKTVEKLCRYATNDAVLEWEGFKTLLPRLSRPEVELPLMQHTLEMYWHPTILIDSAKADNLCRAMQKEITDAIAQTGLSADQISGNKSFENAMRTALLSSGDNPERYWKRTKLASKLADAKTDPERELLLNHPDNNVRFLMEARAAIKSWPGHISRVQGLLAQSAPLGGLLPIAFKYHGAHTGRWSGDEDLNPQNLGGAKSHALIREVRNLLTAHAGHKMTVTDASQIEARILAWLAGQDDLVTRFKNREEIYCGFAARVLGVPIRKAVKPGHPKFMSQTMEDYFTWARDSIGKVGILGCGYGMGTDKIFTYAKGAISIDMADKIKIEYRSANQKIVQFWGDIERAFRYTYQYGKPCELRGLRFESLPDCPVVMVLPSGREVHYPHVEMGDGKYGKTLMLFNELNKTWESTWGGSLTENAVQAIARDVLGEAILAIEKRGKHVPFHCHDEVMCIVPDDQVDETLAIQIEELSREPAWGAGLPLAAEGRSFQFYQK